MLEYAALCLAPWLAGEHRCRMGAGPTPLPRWAVLEPTSRQLLGLVRCLARWLRPPVVEVFETADESFLFGMRGGWWPAKSWRIADADGRPVGYVQGIQLRSWQGDLLAVMETEPGEAAGRWRGRDGRELGSFRAADGGVLAQFAPELSDGSPFLRMLLLASLLRTEG